SFRIIAEEDPQWTVPMNLWPIIVEDNIPGVGYWAGSVFEQAFRKNVFGYYGETLVFEGPYPDTIFTEAEYNILSSWDVDELHLATFVQCAYQANLHEVENCHWAKLMDIPMGIDDAGWGNGSDMLLSVGPNPSMGTINISAVLPGNSAGTIEVFNLAGRMVASGSASEMRDVTVDESGIYLVRLSTSSGMSVTESVAVIR
ncbi:MAG: T9SS type A sorting domain-containing protein, partial [Candidatus Sabulitectum sp.]|nr:T9SS type A sorting domain-containing protein [Candidatus Sabulitectum sp.]